MSEPELTVVVPTYNGQATLEDLCRRLATVLEQRHRSWELLLVDDASPDDTAATAGRLMLQHPQLRYQRLPANVGQHRATVIGMAQARGAVVVTMDDDLQQWPESLPLLVEALRGDVQVVIARFARPAHAVWRRLSSRALALARWPNQSDLVITSFKAFRQVAARQVVAAVPDGPFYLSRVMLQVLPRATLVNVDVEHHPRVHGRSNYGPARLLRLAWQALRRRGTR